MTFIIISMSSHLTYDIITGMVLKRVFLLKKKKKLCNVIFGILNIFYLVGRTTQNSQIKVSNYSEHINTCGYITDLTVCFFKLIVISYM